MSASRSRNATRVVRCPGCGEACEFSARNPFRPFCSERCKNGDFGAWASEHYRVEAKLPADNDDEPAATH